MNSVNEKIQVSVIIVNANGGDLLTQCVQSVLASSVNVEVIVSDNDSRDGSIETLRTAVGHDVRVIVIENRANLGFAKANNIAIPKARGEYILFLNPDCIIRPDTLQRHIAVMEENPGAGMVGCLIRNPDGTEQAGCRRYVPTPLRSFVSVFKLSKIFRKYPRFRSFEMVGQPLPPHPVQVEAISGAFMFVRRSAIDRVGMMDEEYFLHCEDLDWCMQFREAGYAILFLPDADVMHAKGSSSAARPVRVEWYKHKGMVRFYRKFFRRRYPAALMILVIAAVWVRFAAVAGVLLLKGLRAPAKSSMPCLPPAGAPLVQKRATDTIAAKTTIVVTGASSQVGFFLLPRLSQAGYSVRAVSRRASARPHSADAQVIWCEMDIIRDGQCLLIRGVAGLIHLAPLWTILPLLETFAAQGLKRIIAFSSSSYLSKLNSSDASERDWAKKLAKAEQALAEKCAQHGIAWTLFRPTLIYGCGMDKNVTVIAKFIRHFGFFPMLGEGKGRRQPVHADDLALACAAAFNNPAAYNKAYSLSGGETITYHEMVEAIFRAQNRRPRIMKISLGLFDALTRFIALWPRYGYINVEMARRMNTDLCFDHSDASRDFGYCPRALRAAGQDGLDLVAARDYASH